MGRKKFSLFDVLLMKKVELAKLADDEVLEQMYEDNEEDFENQFPHYGFLLNIRFGEALRRRDFVIIAENCLPSVLGRTIPYVVCREIFEMLGESDLRAIGGKNLPVRRIKKRINTKDTDTDRGYCLIV